MKPIDPGAPPVLVDVSPVELLVHDSIQPCPYLPGEQARMPLRLPVRTLLPVELDERLQRGDRRHGALFYRPSCPTCRACEAIRLSTDFPLSRSHRRILRRGDALLSVRTSAPKVSPERVALYNKHIQLRQLAREGWQPMDAFGYQRFLVDRQCESIERAFYLEDELVMISIADIGEKAVSAVYCFHDPDRARLSLGIYAILSQLRECAQHGDDYLYLGLFIHGCAAMAYKGRFLPHERLVQGEWTRFERP